MRMSRRSLRFPTELELQSIDHESKWTDRHLIILGKQPLFDLHKVTPANDFNMRFILRSVQTVIPWLGRLSGVTTHHKNPHHCLSLSQHASIHGPYHATTILGSHVILDATPYSVLSTRRQLSLGDATQGSCSSASPIKLDGATDSFPSNVIDNVAS